MTNQEFVYGAVVGVPVLIAFVSPILKLNSSIVRLNSTIEGQTKDIVTHGDSLKEHTQELDAIKTDIVRHGMRITVLEKRKCKYEEFKKHKGEWHE